jgi:uncharacterized protein YecT (DUF1311 family)
MPVLPDPQRAAAHREWMRDLSRKNSTTGTLSKIAMRNAINAADAWLNNNWSSFRAALPTPAKAQLTNAQLSELLSKVAARRFSQGSN